MVFDEMTGMWYSETTIKPKVLCSCTEFHNSIEISFNKCNNCKKRIKNESTSTT